MPFPLPTPREITARMEASVIASLSQARPEVDPAAIERAVRAPQGLIAAIIRASVLAVYECHLHLRWWGDQYFPDTAELEQLVRHASIWGVVQRPATAAIGIATVTGAPGTIVPAGTRLRGAGTVIYTVDDPATVGADGTGRIALTATAAGAAGNAAAGVSLSIADAVAGLASQVAVTDAGGLAGGAAVEAPASLLARLLAEIREPAHGGARFDYPRWIQNSFAATQVVCLPNWVGPGTVGVAVAMGSAEDPRPPTAPELAAMQAHVEALRPVTAEVHLLPCTLAPQPLTIAIDPYEIKVRLAVEAAVRAFFAFEARIGVPLYRSRLSEAISAAAGEYRHELPVPAGNIVPATLELPVPGPITWLAAP